MESDIHAICSTGGWTAADEWIPLPYVDAHAAELLFRSKVFKLLHNRELLSDERMALLLSWKNSGFSVDNSVTLYPTDEVGLERLARYILRTPVSLERTLFFPDTAQVVSLPKSGHDREAPESLDALEFVARVLIHIPQPAKHSIHYYVALGFM